MPRFVKRFPPAGLMLGIVPIALLVGVWLVESQAVDYLLRHDAVATGESWADYLAANVSDLPQIAEGQRASADSQRFFDRVKKVGQVFRYVIYDAKGHFRLVSDDLSDDEDEDQDLAVHNPGAVEAMAAGRPLINAEEGAPPTRPAFFAEAYVPSSSRARLPPLSRPMSTKPINAVPITRHLWRRRRLCSHSSPLLSAYRPWPGAAEATKSALQTPISTFSRIMMRSQAC